MLALNRLDQATGEASQAGDYELLGLADSFVQHGYGDVSSRLDVPTDHVAAWRVPQPGAIMT